MHQSINSLTFSESDFLSFSLFFDSFRNLSKSPGSMAPHMPSSCRIIIKRMEGWWFCLWSRPANSCRDILKARCCQHKHPSSKYEWTSKGGQSPCSEEPLQSRHQK